MRRRQLYKMLQDQAETTAKIQGDDHLRLIVETLKTDFPIIEKPRRGRPPKVKTCH